MSRASRGRLPKPVSFTEILGTDVVLCDGTGGTGFDDAVAVGVDWEGGEVWPFVWGASPLTSAILKLGMLCWKMFNVNQKDPQCSCVTLIMRLKSGGNMPM